MRDRIRQVSGGIGKRYFFCLLALLWIASAGCPEALAVTDLPIFGPQHFDRTQGKPPVYVETFERCEPSDLALLRVWNGDSKESRIEAARIYVNGALVAAENEFKKKVPYFEKQITVEKVNELKVEVKAGDFKVPAFLKISVLGRNCDATPPVISGQHPADGALLNIARPVIAALFADEANGSGVDPASIRLTLDGDDVTAAATVTASSIDFPPPADLPEGGHSVRLEVSDRAFNVASSSWRFTTDTVPPVPTITSQHDAQYLNTPVVTVAGTLDDSPLPSPSTACPPRYPGTAFPSPTSPWMKGRIRSSSSPRTRRETAAASGSWSISIRWRR